MFYKHVSHDEFELWTIFFLYNMQNCHKIITQIHIKTSWMNCRNLTFRAKSQIRVYCYALSQFIKLAEVTTLHTRYVRYGKRHTGTENSHHRYLIVKSPPQVFTHRKGDIQFLGLTPCSDRGSSLHPREEVTMCAVISWSLLARRTGCKES